MTRNSKPTLLVTGAGGQLGRRVVELLIEAMAGPVIATTRNPEKLADLAAKGVDVREADFDDPASLAAAFAGADRLLLVSTDAVGRPGGRHPQHGAAIEAAAKAGVSHIVYTSGPAPRPTAEDSIPNDHYWSEQALAASPLGWTVLRNNIYAEIILMGLPQAVASGELYTATGSGSRNYVTREDCARAAAAALMEDFDGRRILDVTGPEPVTQDDIAAIASDVAGRPVKHITLDPADLRRGMLEAGLPAIYADIFVGFDVDAAEGYHAIATPTVKELTGREPTSVRDFLESQSAALRAAA